MADDEATARPSPSLHDVCRTGTADDVRALLSKKASTSEGDDGWDINALNKLGATSLHVACQRPIDETTNDTIEIIQALVDAGGLVDAPSKDKSTPLHLACAKGNLSAVALLIQCGANVDAVDRRQQSVLHVAVKQGSVEIVDQLVHHGADVHAVDKFGRCLLHVAVQRKSLEMIVVLVSAGVDVNAVDSDGWSLLHVAVMADSVQVIEALVKEGAEVNTTDQNGKSPLFLGILQGASAAVIQCLVDRGADVNTSDKDGTTLLQYVVEHGSLETMELLVQHGGRVNDVGTTGKSILHSAVERGRDDALRFLMKKGVDVNAVDRDGKSILHVAVAQGKQEIVHFLVRKGVDVNGVDKEGKSLLHIAVEYLPQAGSSVELIAFLIANGVDVNAVDTRGRSPLHVACYLDRFHEAVRFLLNNGAAESLSVEDEDGFCPLHIAAQNLNVELIELLLDAGADVDAPCRGGETPLGIAFFVYNTNCEHAYALAYVVCSRGGEWDTSCDERFSEGRSRARDALIESHEKDTKQATEELQQEVHHELMWRLGLRTCVHYWMNQRREGVPSLSQIPIEVVERGESSVATYLRDLAHASSDTLVYRRKICVVGPGEWGKTSLVKSLTTLEPSLVHKDDRTIGIDLFSCSFIEQAPPPKETINSGDTQPLQPPPPPAAKHHEVTFWDFAGQEIYQVAHSLFYSKRTLYLICVDLEAYSRVLPKDDELSRKGEAAISRFVRRHIFRWVRSIFARQPDAEFVVVGTKTDQLKDIALVTDVWRDLRIRLSAWQEKFVAELEEEYRVARGTLSAPTAKSFAFLRAGKSDLLAQLDALKRKVIHTVSSDWLTVSNAERASVRNARYALEQHLTVNDRGFPMSYTYTRVLDAITKRRLAAQAMSDPKDRIENSILPYKALLRALLRDIDGLEDGDCASILRTLHDLGDVLWYEREGAGALKDVVIIDPTLVIDFVREVINHKHVVDAQAAVVSTKEGSHQRRRQAGHVDHETLCTFPLWCDLDQELLHAFKLLLQYFQLAYSADSKEMDWDSDLIVPAYWKDQASSDRDALTMESFLEKQGFSLSDPIATRMICWDYELSDEIAETVFEHFAVQSYTALFERDVRANCIDSYKPGEFASRIELVKDTGGESASAARVVIRFQVVTAAGWQDDQVETAWLCMRYFVMTMEKVLESYPGLTASRYIVDLSTKTSSSQAAVGTRYRVNDAVKKLEDAASMGRDEATVRASMPWLPPDLQWYIEKAWRRPGALHELRTRRLVQEVNSKTDVLKKLVVAGDRHRRYPALWTFELAEDGSHALLRMLSDLSGLCFHNPLEIVLPSAFMAKHGLYIQTGLSILSTMVPEVISLGILQQIAQAACSVVENKTDNAMRVYTLIDKLEFSPASSNLVTSSSQKLSPSGTMALLRELLQLYDSGVNELTISDLSNLQCAATANGHYVWANRQEIMAMGDKLTPCDPPSTDENEQRTLQGQPQGLQSSSSLTDAPSPTNSSSASVVLKTSSSEKLVPSAMGSLRLTIATSTGLPAWDWRKAYCKWQLVHSTLKTPVTLLGSGTTSQHTDDSVAPSWCGLSFSLSSNRITSIELLRECTLELQVLRPSRLLGMIKSIGAGCVAVGDFIEANSPQAFGSLDIVVPLHGAKKITTPRFVTCHITA